MQAFKGSKAANGGIRVERGVSRRRNEFKGGIGTWRKASKDMLGETLHPWVLRSALRTIRADREAELETIEALGLDLASAHETPTEGEAMLAAVDRFVAARGLEHAGIDRVLQALDQTRYYQHEEDAR